MNFEARLSNYVGLILLVAACSGDSDAITTTSASEASPSTVSGTTVPPATTTTMVENTTTSAPSSYRWEIGDCLSFNDADDLPYEPFGTEPLTTCDGIHTHEVYHTGLFPGGENAAYPEGSIGSDINETCIDSFVDSLGLLPVQTELDILMYLPDADEWASGLRYQGCLVYLPAGLNRFRDLTGTVAGGAEDFALDSSLGDCLSTPNVKVPPVDCSQPHLAEMIGVVTHPAENGAPYPGGPQLELFSVSECDALRSDYVMENERADTIVAFSLPFSEPEWDAGWRELRCMALVLGPDGRIVSVAGSLAEAGWTVVEGDQQA